MQGSGYRLVLVSVHGLIRGHDLELGRDADTGGQTKYVVELARALGERPEVERVDLVTLRIVDPAVSEDYAREVEPLSEKARIVRIDAGLDEYVAKERLWDWLDNFSDNLLHRLRAEDRAPNLIHAHYADAGYVGVRVAHQFGVPLVFTGHSLGRVKRRRLFADGMDAEELTSRFNMTRRIEAEEVTLAAAELVVASSRQEVEEQYHLYDYYHPKGMAVIPPGVDLDRFFPPDPAEDSRAIDDELARFLRHPERPMILALSRPDERKNIGRLVDAYGSSDELRERANLVIVAGNRDDVMDFDPGPRRVLTGLLLLIDSHDLYGKVAYPKHHHPDDVPRLFRLAAASGGIFVNPALTEPFGLTLLEAAASGLPIVATADGGPREIIENLDNGVLVDPLDTDAIRRGLLESLTDREAWTRRARSGIDGVANCYSWRSHADAYLAQLRPILEKAEPLVPPAPRALPIVRHDRAIFTDLDQNLLGDPASIPAFVERIQQHRRDTTFGVATGRSLDSALAAMRKHGIPMPDVLITSTGTAIHYAPDLTADAVWTRHIDHHWNPRSIQRVLDGVPGLELQEKSFQARFKISYNLDSSVVPPPEKINALLFAAEQTVNTIFAFGQYLDVLPVRASKGLALRYFAARWDIALDRILVAGGSGADEDMMRGNTLAAVIANRHEEALSRLVDVESIYFAKESYARGILEAMDHYDLFGRCAASAR